MLFRETVDQGGVEGLGETRVGDRRRQSRLVSSSAALRHSDSLVPRDSSATREPSRMIRPSPDLKRLSAFGELDPDAFASRISKRDRTFVIRGRGGDHMHEFGLVGRRHEHDVRQAAEIGEVVRACVRRLRRRRPGRRGRSRSGPGVFGEPRHARSDRMRAAKRSSRSRKTASGLPRQGRPKTSRRAARRCRRRRRASGNSFAKMSSPVPAGMAAVIGDDLVVLARFAHEALAEHLGVRRRHWSWV